MTDNLIYRRPWEDKLEENIKFLNSIGPYLKGENNAELKKFKIIKAEEENTNEILIFLPNKDFLQSKYFKEDSYSHHLKFISKEYKEKKAKKLEITLNNLHGKEREGVKIGHYFENIPRKTEKKYIDFHNNFYSHLGQSFELSKKMKTS